MCFRIVLDRYSFDIWCIGLSTVSGQKLIFLTNLTNFLQCPGVRHSKYPKVTMKCIHPDCVYISYQNTSIRLGSITARHSDHLYTAVQAALQRGHNFYRRFIVGRHWRRSLPMDCQWDSPYWNWSLLIHGAKYHNKKENIIENTWKLDTYVIFISYLRKGKHEYRSGGGHGFFLMWKTIEKVASLQDFVPKKYQNCDSIFGVA